MIELSLLGPHAVRGPNGREFSSLPAQPKRFALLAYLAIGAGGYHRRDTLAAMFWPDMDQFAARRALRNTLYHLREALGDGVFVTQGDEAVAVDAELLTCDVTRLSAAVAEGQYETAVELNKGELLDGIHFANAGETFEEWLSRERARVIDLTMRAIRALVDREEHAGDAAAAAYWAQRACVLVPGDESCLRRAMSLLDSAGDRGGALRLHETYTRRLAAAFSATPSAETDALAARIRAGQQSGFAAPPRQSEKADHPVTDVSLADVPPQVHVRPSPRRVARWPLAVGALILCGAFAGLAVRALSFRSPPASGARTRVLVTVFENRTGDPRLQSLGRMAEDWLAQGLLRTQVVDVVDQRAVFVQGRGSDGATVDPITMAHRTGAAMVVSGAYYSARDSLIFEASVADANSGQIVGAIGPIVTSTGAPVAALDELRSRVMTALASSVDRRVPRGVATEGEIPPFEAYQSYVEGWDAFWHGDGPRAKRLFLAAAHRDTTFTAAAIGAAMVASNSNDCSLIDSIANALSPRSRSLDRVDRLSLQIAVTHCHGQSDEALRLTLERAELEPRTSNLRLSAAAAALWANRPKQALTILQRIDPSVDLSWSTDTTHFAYFSSLTEALHLLGRHEEELAAANRIPVAAPLSRAWMRGRALAALSRRADVIALVDTALTLPAETAVSIGLAPYTDGRPQYSSTGGWVAVWIARELLVHGDSATAQQVATRAVSWYRSRSPEERATPEERLVAAWSFDLLAAYPDAERLLRPLAAEDSANVDYRAGLAGIAAERRDSVASDATDRWLAAQTVARVSWTASYYRARDAALLGRQAAALADVRRALDEGAWPLWIHLDPAFVPLRGRSDFVALTAPRG